MAASGTADVRWDFEPREVNFSLRLRAEFHPSLASATLSLPSLTAAGAPDDAAPLQLGPLGELDPDVARGRGHGHRPGSQKVRAERDLGTFPVTLEFVQALCNAVLPVSVHVKRPGGGDEAVPALSAARVHLGPLLLSGAEKSPAPPRWEDQRSEEAKEKEEDDGAASEAAGSQAASAVSGVGAGAKDAGRACFPSQVSASLTETIGLAGLYRLELIVVTDVPVLSMEMMQLLHPACFMIDGIRGLPNEDWLPGKCHDVHVEVFPQLSRVTSHLQEVFPRMRTASRPHNATARFSEPVVWLLGLAPPHTIREWLQHDGVVVEVHDRDHRPNPAAVAASSSGGEGGEDVAAAEGGEGEAVPRASEDDGPLVGGTEAINAVLDRHGEVVTRKPHPHGVARFRLGTLLKPGSLNLSMRAEVDPGRSDLKKRKAEASGSGLSAKGLLDTAEGADLIARYSTGGVPKREDTADYHGEGATVVIQAVLALPFPEAHVIHEEDRQRARGLWEASEQPHGEGGTGVFAAQHPAGGADGGGADEPSRAQARGLPLLMPFRAKVNLPDGTQATGPWRDAKEEAEEDERKIKEALEAASAEDGGGATDPSEAARAIAEGLSGNEEGAADPKCLDHRFERFGRAALVVEDEAEMDIIRKALDKILNWNAAVKGVDPTSAEVNTYQLSAEDRADPRLDLLTGFAVLDGKSRIMVFEGLRDKGLKMLLEELGRGQRKNMIGFKLLANPEVGFPQRLYSDFGSLKLPQIKIRAALEKLARKPDLYAVSGVSRVDAEEAGQAIKSLLELKNAPRLATLRKGIHFPKAAHLKNLQILYGGYMTDAELEARPPTPAGAKSKAATAASAAAAAASAAAAGATLAPGSSSGAAVTFAETVQENILTIRPDSLVRATEEAFSSSARDLSMEAMSIGGDRTRRKGATDHQNTTFRSTLDLRKSSSAPDFSKSNKERLKKQSEELAKANVASGKVKERPTPFLDGQEVYIYSGQRLNCTEKQKAWMREKMDKEQTKRSWSYNEHYLSQGFDFSGAKPPGIHPHDPAKPSDTYANAEGDERGPWRHEPARPKEDFRKPEKDIAPSRAEELHEAFAENEWNILPMGQERRKPVATRVSFEPDKIPHHRVITERPFDGSRMQPAPRDFGPKAGFESVHYHGRRPGDDLYVEAERHNVRQKSQEAAKIRGTREMKTFSECATRHCVNDEDRYEEILKDTPSRRLRGRIHTDLPETIKRVTIRNAEELHESGNPRHEWHARLRENDTSPPFDVNTGTYVKRDTEVDTRMKRSHSSGTLRKAPWRHQAPPLNETKKAAGYVSEKDFNITRRPNDQKANESQVWKNATRSAVLTKERSHVTYKRPADYGVAHLLT